MLMTKNVNNDVAKIRLLILEIRVSATLYRFKTLSLLIFRGDWDEERGDYSKVCSYF